MLASGSGGAHSGQIVSMASSPQVSSGAQGMDLVPLTNKPVLEKKATVYAEVVKNLNNARERGLPFKVIFFFWFPFPLNTFQHKMEFTLNLKLNFFFFFCFVS